MLIQETQIVEWVSIFLDQLPVLTDNHRVGHVIYLDSADLLHKYTRLRGDLIIGEETKSIGW